MAAERKLVLPGGIVFPSSDALSFYKSSTFTPTVTFATPGSALVTTYNTRIGEYTAIGNLVVVTISIVMTTFTFDGTSAGSFLIGTLPYAANSATNYTANGACSMRGWTKANFTNTVLNVDAGATTLTVLASGSAQTPAALATGDIPSGGNVTVRGTITYQTS